MIEYFLMAFFAAGGQDAGTSSPSAGSAQQRGVAPADFKNPVHITADRFEIQGKRQQAVWIGRVKAVRGRTVLNCERLIAHYTKKQEITRIECVGQVEATHGDMWARGERADFDNVTGMLVVTGSPQARKGSNEMKGSRVTFDVARDTILVENAQTVFESSSTRVLPKSGTRPQETR
jgi:lipopolysaccharide export system protein LptA